MKSCENGKKHTQIIHFIGGVKRTIRNIVCVWENEMTHILTENGTEWIINKNNVLIVEKPNNGFCYTNINKK